MLWGEVRGVEVHGVDWLGVLLLRFKRLKRNKKTPKQSTPHINTASRRGVDGHSSIGPRELGYPYGEKELQGGEEG